MPVTLWIQLLLLIEVSTRTYIRHVKADIQNSVAMMCNKMYILYILIGGPYWLIVPDDVSVPVGGSVSLSCKASSMFPVSYRWLYQQESSSPATEVQGFSSSGGLVLEVS